MLSKKWHLRYLEDAKNKASWSKDPSTKVGAVVIGKYGQPLSMGYNGFPRKINDNYSLLGDREEKMKRTIHAELNCIYNASLSGISLDGATIYVYGLPVCSACALGVIQVGITHVHAAFDPSSERVKRWEESTNLAFNFFDEAGVCHTEWALP